MVVNNISVINVQQTGYSFPFLISPKIYNNILNLKQTSDVFSHESLIKELIA